MLASAHLRVPESARSFAIQLTHVRIEHNTHIIGDTAVIVAAGSLCLSGPHAHLFMICYLIVARINNNTTLYVYTRPE